MLGRETCVVLGLAAAHLCIFLRARESPRRSITQRVLRPISAPVLALMLARCIRKLVPLLILFLFDGAGFLVDPDALIP